MRDWMYSSFGRKERGTKVILIFYFIFRVVWNLHFFYQRKTDTMQRNPQKPHCVPLQLPHKLIVEELAILRPYKWKVEVIRH
jgi:hypothetical protein